MDIQHEPNVAKVKVDCSDPAEILAAGLAGALFVFVKENKISEEIANEFLEKIEEVVTQLEEIGSFKYSSEKKED